MFVRCTRTFKQLMKILQKRYNFDDTCIKLPQDASADETLYSWTYIMLYMISDTFTLRLASSAPTLLFNINFTTINTLPYILPSIIFCRSFSSQSHIKFTSKTCKLSN